MKRRALGVTAIVMIALALDLRRAPADQWSTAAAVAGIHVYQATLSRVYDRMGAQCRFTPTCSHYGEEVVKRFGVVRGGWMATKRILRCGPWTPLGTSDPAPLT
jgi:putative membrane protein insertion efficiency factor